MKIHIVEATKEDKDFILSANREIDEVSYIKSSKLAENLEKDLFEEKLAVCLIAKIGKKRAGMCLFSNVYWADRGQGIYVSQVLVDKKFRKRGVFKKLFAAAFEYFPNTKFLTCLVAQKNETMVECMTKLSFEDENMISYAKNKDDFEKIFMK